MPSADERDVRAIARERLARFGLCHVTFRHLPGNTDQVFAVRSSFGRFVLRLRKAGAMGGPVARLQQRWLAAIADKTDVVVPRVVKIDDVDQTVLLTWVDGRPSRDARAFVQPKRLDAVGATTAKLHLHGQRFRIDESIQLRRLNAATLLGRNSVAGALGWNRLSRTNFAHLHEWSVRIRSAMRDLAESPKHFGVIHGDLEPPNWIFHHGVACPIDFESFAVGYYVYDLAQILWTHSMWPEYERYRARLLAAYESIRPLDSVERRHLRAFEALPLIDWISRQLRDPSPTARAGLKQWLPPTIARLRELYDAS